MSKKANKTMIGVFVVGAVALLILSFLIFGSGYLFKHTQKYVLFFDGTVKGLAVGAPVIFKGVNIGSVNKINLIYDPNTKIVLIAVIIDVELSRVKGGPEQLGYDDYKLLVKQGLRTRLEIKNFISGDLMLSMDFYPDKEAKFYNIKYSYSELPALPISPDIFAIMKEIPIKKITADIDQIVSGMNRLVNSKGIEEMDNTLHQVTALATSARLFFEYIEQHPEALLKGKLVPKGR